MVTVTIKMVTVTMDLSQLDLAAQILQHGKQFRIGCRTASPNAFRETSTGSPSVATKTIAG